MLSTELKSIDASISMLKIDLRDLFWPCFQSEISGEPCILAEFEFIFVLEHLPTPCKVVLSQKVEATVKFQVCKRKRLFGEFRPLSSG